MGDFLNFIAMGLRLRDSIFRAILKILTCLETGVLYECQFTSEDLESSKLIPQLLYLRMTIAIDALDECDPKL